MATYYVQTCQNTENARWLTVEETEDKGWAEYLAEQLDGHQQRVSRVISRSKLLRTEGTRALVIAEEEVALGMGDAERIPRMRELYAELDAERKRVGTVDFLLRDMPRDLHSAIKRLVATSEDQEAEDSMTAWILAACLERLAAG